MSRDEVARILARQRGDAPPVKRRKKPGTGDLSQYKAWLAEMARQPGIFYAGRTVASVNAREHWAKKDARNELERNFASVSVWAMLRTNKIPLPARVTFTRYGPNVLDDDNLRSALKALRDGVADGFGVDDGNGSGLRFEYAEQVKTKRGHYGVRIVCEPLTGDAK